MLKCIKDSYVLGHTTNSGDFFRYQISLDRIQKVNLERMIRKGDIINADFSSVSKDRHLGYIFEILNEDPFRDLRYYWYYKDNFIPLQQWRLSKIDSILC